MSMDIQNSTIEKMKSVRVAWEKASPSPKRDAAMTHYQAAEKAQVAKNDADCLKALDAATKALA